MAEKPPKKQKAGLTAASADVKHESQEEKSPSNGEFKSELTDALDSFFDGLEDETPAAGSSAESPVTEVKETPSIPKKRTDAPSPPAPPRTKAPGSTSRSATDQTEKDKPIKKPTQLPLKLTDKKAAPGKPQPPSSIEKKSAPQKAPPPVSGRKKTQPKAKTVRAEKKAKRSGDDAKPAGKKGKTRPASAHVRDKLEPQTSPLPDEKPPKTDSGQTRQRTSLLRLIAIPCILLVLALAVAFYRFGPSVEPPVQPEKTQSASAYPIVQPQEPNTPKTAPEPIEKPASGADSSDAATTPATAEKGLEPEDTAPMVGTSVPTEEKPLSPVETEPMDWTNEMPPATEPSMAQAEIAAPPAVPLKAPEVEPKKADPEMEIRDFMTRWNAAWEAYSGSNGSLDPILDFYSESFASRGLKKTARLKEMANPHKKKKWSPIRITEITGPENLVETGLTVRYVSGINAADGDTAPNTTMVLAKEPEEWKIVADHYPQRSYPYTIHAGSFKSAEAAGNAAGANRKSGLKSFWVKADLGAKGIWYRVFIGCLETRTAAEKLIAERKLKNVLIKKTAHALHVGTYLSEQRLSERLQDLSKQGHSPYFIKDEVARFHLYLGAFINLESAQLFEGEMRSQGIRSETVKR